jgi:hypothetical protein
MRLKSPAKGRGAIALHELPQHSAIRLISPVKMDKALSPNEEILRAIGKLVATPSIRSRERKKTSEQGRGSFGSRIGVWRNGGAFWDGEKRPLETTQALHKRPTSPSYQLTRSDSRPPRLSVVIPDSKIRQVLGEEAPIPPEARQPHRTTPSAATTGIPTPPHSKNLDQSLIHPAFRTSSLFSENQINEVKSLSSNDNNRSSLSSHGNNRSSLSSNDNNRSSMSSNTNFPDDTFDHVSCYSRHSSITSVDAESSAEVVVQNPHWNYLDIPNRSVSAAFSVTSPVHAGIFDDTLRDEHTRHAGSSSQHIHIPALHTKSRASQTADFAVRSFSCPPDLRPAPSLTLSEAVDDLQAQLARITEESPSTLSDHGLTHTLAAESVVRVPTLPKRSRKREWIKPTRLAAVTSSPARMDVPVRRQSVPSIQEKLIKDEELRRASSVTLKCTLMPWRLPFTTNTPVLALENQTICLSMLAASSSMEDLWAFSMINKATRQVYKSHELQLLKSVMFNISPPAWELRELSPCPFGNTFPTDFLEVTELTPSSYLSGINDNRAIVQELKTIIVTRYQSLLRPETISSLMTAGSTRFEDAIYRIWSFCKIFGCDSSREHDLKAQMDWLNGGTLAHEKDCVASLTTTPDVQFDGILINAPSHFAAGNSTTGLSVNQLYDMIELWQCLCKLMQPYSQDIVKAQDCGIFDHQHPLQQDATLTAQESLDEWVSYIMTLGPSVILALARFHHNLTAGYDFADLNDWTDWMPPLSRCQSRRGFFRDAAIKVYEERLIAFSRAAENAVVSRRMAATATTMTKKTLVRRRQMGEMNVAYRLKKTKALSRSNSVFTPEIYYNNNNNKNSSQRHSFPSSTQFADAVSSDEEGDPTSCSPTPMTSITPTRTTRRRISPIIEDRVFTFNRLSMLNFDDDTVDDTVGLAVGKLVDMGFSAEQAREALRATDIGSGLKLDRAVDYLLRQTSL